MPVHVVMPKLGLTMASGTIARWIKRPGEAVREGEPLLEVSTDKINYEVESPATGTVARTLGSDGEEFECGAVIGVIALSGESDAPAARTQGAPLPVSTAPDSTSPARVVEAPRVSAAANGVTPTRESATIPPRSNGERIVASPAARRLARERGIALHGVRGSGPRGRIVLADIPAAPAMPTPDVTLGDVTLRLSKGEPPQLPASRRAIYRKMTEVGVLPIPQVETVVRVDAIVELIGQRRDFGWTAFATYAVARLLRDHPEIRTNAETGAPFERCDIGLAADTPHGLIVPVVREADQRSLAEIHREIVRLAAVARDGTISSDDVSGACFSISNVGPQGVERVAPLPDPPQTAILGIGAATQRPAVVNGGVLAAWMLTCVVSFDHRFIDGAPAARFLAAVARAFENPGTLL